MKYNPFDKEPFSLEAFSDFQVYITLQPAEAVIMLVHKYGYNPHFMPAEIMRALRMISCNCYWGGMFGEVGMKCCRCPRVKRENCLSRRM